MNRWPHFLMLYAEITIINALFAFARGIVHVAELWKEHELAVCDLQIIPPVPPYAFLRSPLLARLPVTTLNLNKNQLKLTNGVVFNHAQWVVNSRSDEGLVITSHGHREEAHGDRSRFG